MAQFMPRVERARKAAEFATLIQGRMSVAEYDLQFRTLSRYLRWTQYDEEEMARKFQDGLKPSIRGKMAAVLTGGQYTTVVEIARQIEREEEMWAKSQPQRRAFDHQPQTRRSGPRGKSRFHRQQRPQRQTQLQPMLPATQGCTICGGQHRGPCLTGTGLCFRCGQPGHIARDCTMAQVAQGTQYQLPARHQQAAVQRGRGRPPQYLQQRRPLA